MGIATHTYGLGSEKMGLFSEGKPVMISTTIPAKVYEAVKAKHWKHNEIYLLGFQAKLGNPAMLERIQQLEKEVEGRKADYYRMRKLLMAATGDNKKEGE